MIFKIETDLTLEIGDIIKGQTHNLSMEFESSGVKDPETFVYSDDELKVSCDYVPGCDAKINCAPEDSYPAEAPEIDGVVIKMKGVEISAYLTKKKIDEIENYLLEKGGEEEGAAE